IASVWHWLVILCSVYLLHWRTAHPSFYGKHQRIPCHAKYPGSLYGVQFNGICCCQYFLTLSGYIRGRTFRLSNLMDWHCWSTHFHQRWFFMDIEENIV